MNVYTLGGHRSRYRVKTKLAHLEPTRVMVDREGDVPADQAQGIRVARDEQRAEVVPLHRRGGGGELLTIAVTSGKGGVGKTQLSANLGVSLAQAGLRVLMLDADLGLASLDLALGVQPKLDLRAVVRGEAKADEIITEGPMGVHLLAACPGRYDMANLQPDERRRMTEAVDELAAQYDVFIVDTGAGIGTNAVSFAAGADEVLLVVTPDPTSMRDAYAMAKVLHRRSGVDKIRLVANQVGSDAEGLEVHERLDSIVRKFLALRLEYLGAIPHDRDVTAGVRAGEPYVLGSPTSPAARAIKVLVRRLFPNLPHGAPRLVN